jgi:hypothetical protein
VLLFRYTGCYSWPGLKANPIEAAHGKLVPPHTWQMVEFELGKGFDRRNAGNLKSFPGLQGRIARRPSTANQNTRVFIVPPLASFSFFFEGVANETKSFPKGRIHIF